MKGGPCGKFAILAFLKICKNKVKIPGTLISHYKSSNIEFEKFSKSNYVSYISIIYEAKNSHY
jgi:hypothetical protein